jgi:hypothetical protein
MTRRSRWSLVVLVCAAIIVGGTPPGRAAVLHVVQVATAPATRTRVLALLQRVPVAGVIGAGAALLLVLLAGVVGRQRRARRRDRAADACRLNERGATVPAIARETGLAQDAVRDVIEAATLAGRPNELGRKFRLSRVDPPSFAEVLAQTGTKATR